MPSYALKIRKEKGSRDPCVAGLFCFEAASSCLCVYLEAGILEKLVGGEIIKISFFKIDQIAL